MFDKLDLMNSLFNGSAICVTDNQGDSRTVIVKSISIRKAGVFDVDSKIVSYTDKHFMFSVDFNNRKIYV